MVKKSSRRNSRSKKIKSKRSRRSRILKKHIKSRGSKSLRGGKNRRLKRMKTRRNKSKLYGGSGPADQWIAQYDYTKTAVDEIDLKEDDVVINVEIVDDGWAKGTNTRTGETGIMPSNYIEKASATAVVKDAPVTEKPENINDINIGQLYIHTSNDGYHVLPQIIKIIDKNTPSKTIDNSGAYKAIDSTYTYQIFNYEKKKFESCSTHCTSKNINELSYLNYHLGTYMDEQIAAALKANKDTAKSRKSWLKR